MYLGDFRLGETFDTKFTTIASTGAPITLAGTPAIAAYPGNSTTEITAGITLSVDFDTRTGLHNVRVVATSGNGYATATNYALVLTAGTVDGVSVVGYVVAHFSVEARSALMPTTAARTLDVSAGGEAGVDWANVGSPTTALNLSGTNIDVDQVVASVSGAVGSVGAGGITAASFAANAITAAKLDPDVTTELQNGLATAAALATVDGIVDDILLDTAEIGAAGAGLTNINLPNQTMDIVGNITGNLSGSVGSVTGNVGGNVTGSVGSVATGGIAAASFAAGAVDAASLAANAVDEILDDTIGDGTLTVRQALRVIVASLAGKLSGAATTTVTIRNAADTADVIVATVDADGNRSAVTVTP